MGNLSSTDKPHAKGLAVVSGVLPTALGCLVLFGWYTHSVTFIQVSPHFVPMQYNTALGFLLCGLGLLFATRAIPVGKKSGSWLCASLVAIIGALTLLEYGLDADFGIDQLLMEHYITVATSHPGRMAPNTALCFFLTGGALLVTGGRIGSWTNWTISTFGSLVLGLGVIAFLGYLVNLETAYGWGKLTRMAIHTAAGFITLGFGLLALAWSREGSRTRTFPAWFPLVIGIGVLTVTISLWQALNAVKVLGIAQYFVLIFGAVLSFALAMVTNLAEKLGQRAKAAQRASRQLEQEVAEREHAQVQLIQSSKLATLGEMATAMAHELNQPLNIIRMAADNTLERIEEGDVDPEYLQGKLERISAQTERAAAIIDHMRIFGRKADAKPEPFDPREAVKGALGLVGQQLRLREIEVETALSGHCRSVLGHASQLEQVVLNLLTNARHAIEANRTLPGDPKKISLSVEDMGRENMVRLTVEDSGGGIPEDVLPRIFEPFYTTKKKGEGTGLGLSVSYGIIKDTGGTIEAANAGEGARFTITLPIMVAYKKSSIKPKGSSRAAE